MFSGLQIYAPRSIETRSYVEFYASNKRFKVYNGKLIGINCHPNRCKTIKERNVELKRLEQEIYTKLKNGWLPNDTSKKADTSIKHVLENLRADILKDSYSATYKRDLVKVIDDFQRYISNRCDISVERIEKIDSISIESFLAKYNSSGTYYMNKRRALTVIFSKLIKCGILNQNPVKNTSKKRVKVKLNQPFTDEQIKEVLNYLKLNYPLLYLCALLMYGTLLRPHQEILNLKRQHFDEELNYITLNGYENKSGKIRKVPIPEYIKIELIECGILKMKNHDYIFSIQGRRINSYYFSLQWSRAKTKLKSAGVVNENQTLYSFRHSAARHLFNRHQNLNLLQQLFGHSNISVTMIYLRGLGLGSTQDETLMPSLNF